MVFAARPVLPDATTLDVHHSGFNGREQLAALLRVVAHDENNSGGRICGPIPPELAQDRRQRGPSHRFARLKTNRPSVDARRSATDRGAIGVASWDVQETRSSARIKSTAVIMTQTDDSGMGRSRWCTSHDPEQV